jgi:hypothetical protein
VQLQLGDAVGSHASRASLAEQSVRQLVPTTLPSPSNSAQHRFPPVHSAFVAQCRGRCELGQLPEQKSLGGTVKSKQHDSAAGQDSVVTSHGGPLGPEDDETPEVVELAVLEDDEPVGPVPPVPVPLDVAPGRPAPVDVEDAVVPTGVNPKSG